MLNYVGQTIISVSKGVGQWKNVIVNSSQNGKPPEPFTPQSETVPEKKMYVAVRVEPELIVERHHNFFKTISENKEVTKALVGLSNCLHSFKLELATFKTIWLKYSSLWTVDRDNYIIGMEEEQPSLREYEEVLKKYKTIKEELQEEYDSTRVGTLSISTIDFKASLNMEIHQWNNMIVLAIYTRFRKEMETIIATQLDFMKKLSRPIEGLEDIRIIMETQKAMREIEINIEMDIEVVEHAFTLIAKFGYQASKEDIELVKNMSSTWQELRKKAMK